MSNYIPLFCVDGITFPCPELDRSLDNLYQLMDIPDFPWSLDNLYQLMDIPDFPWSTTLMDWGIRQSEMNWLISISISWPITYLIT